MTDANASIPSSHLMEFILGLLAPFLMTGSITDSHLARLAAAEAIAGYQARGQSDLVTVAQILGFALTALDNLRLSMAADLSLSMKLKLRGNANTLNRSALLGTEAREKPTHGNPPPAASLAEQAAMASWDEPKWDEPKPEPEQDPANVAPIPQPAPPKAAAQATSQPPAGHQNQVLWADAMRTQAAALRADTANRSATEQKTNKLWIDVLNEVANELTAKQPAAVMSKTDLMRTTLMAGGASFPPDLFTANKRPVITRKPAR